MGETIVEEFALLDLVTTACLHSLRQFSNLSFAAVMSSSWFSDIRRKKHRKGAIIDLTLNVMGPEDLADDVGNAVAAASGYFQHPVYLEAGIRYINPHYFYPGNEKSDLRHFIRPAKKDSRATRLREGIENLLDSLGSIQSSPASTRGKDVSHLVNQCLIDTQLKRLDYYICCCIWPIYPWTNESGTLFSHQIDGIEFILNREDPSFCHAVNSDLLQLINSR
jgi:SWI/SNF-related matrix-associated actin-dependent regulator of chromatin subfamily A3